jgi:[acyl-carrier-protein] S-malonyltransferase
VELDRTALAFRGYNITNLGRSAELLAHPRYGPVVRQYLKEASRVCADTVDKRVDLVARVRNEREPSLRNFAETIALTVSLELAQLRLLEEFHDIDASEALLSFGYSLGELTAVSFGGVFDMATILEIPLTMARDCAELAEDVTMGVLFSRGPAIVEENVLRTCLRVNAERKGVISMSSILSPNTVLLLGQSNTVKHFGAMMHDLLPREVHLRVNPHRWPPLHTSIMWQRSIPNRAAVMMQKIPGGFTVPRPQVLSLVTGKTRYTDVNTRDMLHRWIDHPQRLWEAMYEVLACGVRTMIHVGPEPNLIPATFKRLSDNIAQQASGRSLGSLGLRAVSGMAHRRWLAGLLPSRTSLLRAPTIRHVVLEDWLLANAP